MSDNNVIEMPGAMTGEYLKGQEPWNKWLLVYKCTQCGQFCTEKPGARTLAALDLQYIDNQDDEPTRGHLLQLVMGGSEPTKITHECDKRAVGIAEITGVSDKEGKVLVVPK